MTVIVLILLPLKNANVKVTTKFMNGKMLTFSKISLTSFVFSVVDVFLFPDNVTQESTHEIG